MRPAATRQEAKAEAKAAAARAKALRPWFKKKRIMIPLVLVVIIGISAIASSGGKDDDKTTNASSDTGGSSSDPNSSEADLFPNRPDEKKGDKERNIGGAADLSGYTVTVTAAGGQQELTQFEDEGYLVAEVTILNRDKAAQSYNEFDWKLITPSGTIIDPCLCTGQLGAGDLAQNGTISGKIVFETKNTPGDYYVIFDPSDLGNDNRGVWKVTV